MLADVTSVSYGDVGLNFRSDGNRRTVEPAVESSEDDLALLGIYMRTSTTGLELIEEMQNRLEVFSSFDRATRNGEDWTIEWESINVVHVNGSNARNRCRRLAWRRTKIESLALMSHVFGDVKLQRRFVLSFLLRSFDVPPHLSQDSDHSAVTADADLDYQVPADHSALAVDSDDCQFFNTTFLKGPGVSPVLTATESLNHVSPVWLSQTALRYSTSLLCASINVGIIVISGLLGESFVTLSLITAGVCGSFAGSWITAILIYRATNISYFPMGGLKVLCAGYFSNSKPDGIGLTYLPSIIAISTASQSLCRLETLIFTGLLSTSSFCILYLGLRAAQWWVPLAILANIAFTTCMRAVLGYEINVDSSRSELASRFSRYRRKAVLCHLLAEKHNGNNHHSSSASVIEPCDANHGQKNLFKGELKEKGAWSILSFAGTAKSCSGSYVPSAQDLNIAEKVEKTLLYNAYNISLWLHRETLTPVGTARYGCHKASYLPSEFLAPDRIWHQPFEVLLPLRSEDTDLILDEERITELLRMWITESFSGSHGLPQCSIGPKQPTKVSHVLRDFFCDEADMIGLQELVVETARLLAMGQDPPRSTWTSIWSHKAMLWMAIKMIFATRPSWMSSEEFTRILKQRRDRADPLRSEESSLNDDDVVVHCLSRTGTLRLEIEELVPSYVECLTNRGLVVPDVNP